MISASEATILRRTGAECCGQFNGWNNGWNNGCNQGGGACC